MKNNIVSNTGENSITNRMMEYINSKYPEDNFIFTSVFGGGSGASSKDIIVSSDNFPDCEIYVRYTKDGENEEFTDNYLGVKYEAQTVAQFEAILTQVAGDDFFLAYDVSKYACPNKDGDMTFEEYIASPMANLGFTAVVNLSVADRERFENEFSTAMLQAKICCFGTIYFEEDIETIRSLTSEDLSAYIYHKTYSDQFTFAMKNNTNFSEMTWGD